MYCRSRPHIENTLWYSPVDWSGVLYSSTSLSGHGLSSSPAAANAGAASSFLIGFLERTNRRSPDQLAFATSRSANLATKPSRAFCSAAGDSADALGDRTMRAWTFSSPLAVCSSKSMSDSSTPSSFALWNTSRTVAGSTRVKAPFLSLNARITSVPPLKSIVQFMYSPRTSLFTIRIAMVAAVRKIDSQIQVLNLLTNWKLVPGGSRYRNLCSLIGASDRDGGRVLVPDDLPVEQDARDPGVGGDRGEHADEHHHGEALDRPGAVLQQHPRRRRDRELSVEDRGER